MPKAIAALKGRWRANALTPATLLGLLAVSIVTVYPMMWLALGSFGGEAGFTLENYRSVFRGLGPLDAMKNSMVFSGGALVLGMAMAAISALSTTRLRTPFAGLVRSASIIAFVNPPWITAMAYAWLLSPQAGTFNRWTDALFGVKPFNAFSMSSMVFVAALFLYPYLYLTLSAALENVDSTYEEAALTAGASPWKMLRRVTLPLVTPAMVTAVVFSIVILWESFSIPAILGTPGNIYVFATYLYRLLNTPPPNLGLSAAIAVFFAVTAGLAVWLGLRVARRHHGGRFQVIAGKGHRAVQIEVGWMKYPLAAFNLTVLAFALVVPYVTLAVLSLSANIYQSFSLSNLTLRHYLDHFRSPVFHEIFWNTLQVAFFMSAATGLIALLVAYLDVRGRGPLKDLLSFIATFPIAVPGVAFVVGVAWAWLRPPLVLYGTIWIIVVCQISRFLPLGVQHLRDGLSQIRPELEEAARTCGAGTFTMLRRITVPVIRPVAVATFLLLWMASMRDLLTPLFLGTGTPETSTLSQRIYFLWGEGLTPQSASLAVILVSLMAVLYVVMRIALDLWAPKGRSPKTQAPTGTAAVGA